MKCQKDMKKKLPRLLMIYIKNEAVNMGMTKETGLMLRKL